MKNSCLLLKSTPEMPPTCQKIISYIALGPSDDRKCRIKKKVENTVCHHKLNT